MAILEIDMNIPLWNYVDETESEEDIGLDKQAILESLLDDHDGHREEALSLIKGMGLEGKVEIKSITFLEFCTTNPYEGEGHFEVEIESKNHTRQEILDIVNDFYGFLNL